jgi:ABC-type Fe3+ transport system permease subunit
MSEAQSISRKRRKERKGKASIHSLLYPALIFILGVLCDFARDFFADIRNLAQSRKERKGKASIHSLSYSISLIRNFFLGVLCVLA